MTVTNPSPIANPFNQHDQHINQYRSFLTKTDDPASLTVPESRLYGEILTHQHNSLTVPNSNIPYNNGPIPVLHNGFISTSSLFRCDDGTILDLNTHKIVYDPNSKFKAKGYWNDPTFSIDNYEQTWEKTESIESLLARCEDKDNTYHDPNLSPESIRYWKKAKEESLKLQQNMTNYQKELLHQLQTEQFFPMTKLVEESISH